MCNLARGGGAAPPCAAMLQYDSIYLKIIINICCHIYIHLKKKQWTGEKETAKGTKGNSERNRKTNSRDPEGTSKGREMNSKRDRKRNKREPTKAFLRKRNTSGGTGTGKKRRSGKPCRNMQVYNIQLYYEHKVCNSGRKHRKSEIRAFVIRYH